MAQAATSLEDDVARFAGLHPDGLAARWQVYARLREEAPALKFGNSVLVSRHEDCLKLLLDQDRVHTDAPSHGVPADVLGRLSADERMMLDEIIDWEERWLTAVNGDRHTELRNLGQRIFAPRAIADMNARIHQITAEMLDALSGEVEFVGDFAYKLPLQVISEILDIPVEMREPLHEACGRMMVARTGLAWRMQLPAGLAEAHEAFMDVGRMLKELLRLRRGTATTPIIANVLEALDEGAAEMDMVVLLQILVLAGHNSTTDLLSTGLHALLSHRAQWEALCADASLIPNAVEEMLRYRGPAQDVDRFAASDFTLHGTELHRGDHITIVVGSANFDDAAFEAPERFDVRRSDTRSHLSFGRGVHFCLGSALSRMEAAEVLEAGTRRFPDVELVSPEPDWVANTHLLGLTRLPIVMGSDRG